MKLLILMLVSLAVVACGVPQEEHDTVKQELADLKLTSDTQLSELESKIQTLQQDYETVVKDYCPMSLAVNEVELALQVLILEQQASATLIEEGLLAMLMEKGFGGLSDSEWEKMENWNARQDSMEEARYQKIRQITNVELNKALRAPDQTGDREVAQLFSVGITTQEMVQNSRVSDDMENLFKAMKAVLAKGAQSPYKESFSDCPAWNF